jgi:hypothetical protein
MIYSLSRQKKIHVKLCIRILVTQQINKRRKLEVEVFNVPRIFQL